MRRCAPIAIDETRRDSSIKSSIVQRRTPRRIRAGITDYGSEGTAAMTVPTPRTVSGGRRSGCPIDTGYRDRYADHFDGRSIGQSLPGSPSRSIRSPTARMASVSSRSSSPSGSGPVFKRRLYSFDRTRRRRSQTSASVLCIPSAAFRYPYEWRTSSSYASLGSIHAQTSPGFVSSSRWDSCAVPERRSPRSP